MGEGKIKAFTDLIVWQKGHELVIDIYEITKSFPKEEIFSLTNQMRRASASVTSNIAEGFGRHSYKEKIQFYYLANGSLTELINQLLIARDVGHLKGDQFAKLENLANEVQALLLGLISKSKAILNS